MSFELVEEKRCFGGMQLRLKHASATTGTLMRVAVYVPPQAQKGPVPVLYYLSGLTCTEENFTFKAGAQRYAAEHGIMIVAPDTSPRDLALPGEDAAYDFGSGAGFYVDALREPWSSHYRMYTYVTQELPSFIETSFPADRDRRGVFGHSMGGHGALVCAFRNPDRYRSVSAFAPICAPTKSPWGRKAFEGYLGSDTAAWASYDATLLTKQTTWRRPVLVDQGTADEFLERELMPSELEQACRSAGIPLELRMQEGYDHSYYFIASFVGDHIAFHAKALKA